MKKEKETVHREVEPGEVKHSAGGRPEPCGRISETFHQILELL